MKKAVAWFWTAVAAACILHFLWNLAFVARHWRWSGFSTQWVVIGSLGALVLILLPISKRRERERVAALFAERRAAVAAANLGLAPTDEVLPPEVASARAFGYDEAVTGRPLRGNWEGGELLVVDHSYLRWKEDEGEDGEEVRRYRTIFAFRLPAASQGCLPTVPWKAQAVGDWLVLSRPGRAEPVTTAELAAQLEQARGHARRALL